MEKVDTITIENESRDMKFLSKLEGPGKIHIGDYGSGTGMELEEQFFGRVVKETGGFEESGHGGKRRKQVDIVAPFWETTFLPWKLQLDDTDLQAGIDGARKNRVVAGGVVGCDDDGDNGATVGKKLGEVNHGDHMALCHEWEQKEVRGSHVN